MTTRPLDDENARGFRCAAGHPFYSFYDEHGGIVPASNTIEPPHLADDRSILRYWLLDPPARLRVPNKLAVVVRRILELSEGGQPLARIDHPFRFCTICGEQFTESDVGDGYLWKKSCRHGHTHWEHQYTLFPGDVVGKDNLSIELYDEFLPKQLDAYLTHEMFEWYIHPQLRDALTRFARTKLADSESDA